MLPVSLFGPAALLFGAILLPALALFLIVSTYHFTGMRVEPVATFDAYMKFFTDPFYIGVMLEGLKLAVVSTVVCLVLGYPTAYALTKIRHPRLLLIAYILIFSPLLSSTIVRAYGWLVLLSDSGTVNWLLIHLGLAAKPVRLIFNFIGVVVALVHYLLPFTIFPILTVLLRQERGLHEAAADLGANRIETFLKVAGPLSFPGIYSAAQLTFVLALNSFVTTQLLGGGRVVVLPQLIYQRIIDLNWPLAAVQAVVLVVLTCGAMLLTGALMHRQRTRPARVAA